MTFLLCVVLFSFVSCVISVNNLPFAFNYTQLPTEACHTFQQKYPGLTSFPNQPNYVEANTDYFTASAWLGPACVFAPTNALQMSDAVNTLTRLSTPFAIRGGGHMPIANAANINSSGVLLSSSGLSQLQLSMDHQTVSVGPGNRWGDVYQYLEPFGLTVVGGRMGVVGVPGFLLGGGISFFSNQYGWASANVVSYTCILANGSVVKATATNEYADLFWALRGGGNSFAIVTSFELKTLATPAVMVGQASYGADVRDQWLDSVYSFAVNGSKDAKAAITPIVQYSSLVDSPTYSAMRFYDGNQSSPAALANFTAPVLTPTNDTFSLRSMYEWTTVVDAGFSRVHGFRERFYVVSIHADKEAMSIIHDTYMEAAQRQLPALGTFITGVAFMPITKQYIIAGNINGGDPQGVDPTGAPYIWIEESITYTDSITDATIDEFFKDVNANISIQLKEHGINTAPFLYLNDADKGQPVFEGYPPENLERLRRIRAKYDPAKIFTNLMPGGWKVDCE